MWLLAWQPKMIWINGSLEEGRHSFGGSAKANAKLCSGAKSQVVYIKFCKKFLVASALPSPCPSCGTLTGLVTPDITNMR